MKYMKIKNLLLISAAGLLLASCGAKKAIVNPTPAVQPSVTSSTSSPAVRKLSFVQRVSDNQVYQKNIVGDMSFSLKAGSLDHTVPGSLHMRKDEVIRIQIFIPLLGSEIGRLEFTPDYVLVVDRMHKQYVKASYSQLDFLRQNGLNFYSLQALFWNQLLLPGSSSISESDLKKFDVDLDASGTTLPVTLQNGKLHFKWDADRNNGRIVEANVAYQSDSHGKSTLNWKYGNFKSVGVKVFPADQTFSFATNAGGKQQQATVDISMDRVTTDSNWDARTVVSNKYKQVDAEEALSKILKM